MCSVLGVAVKCKSAKLQAAKVAELEGKLIKAFGVLNYWKAERAKAIEEEQHMVPPIFHSFLQHLLVVRGRCAPSVFFCWKKLCGLMQQNRFFKDENGLVRRFWR